MRRVRWKRKDAFVQTCSKRKFGECGSQLFCSEICFLLRGTGGVRISFSLVHRADSHMKPRDANRTPSASFPLPLVLIYRAGQRLAKRKARKEKQVKSGFAAPMNATPPNAGTQFFEVCLSAQPVEGHRTFSAVCDGQPPVLGDLTRRCQITPQRFFFCTVSGTFSFWQENVGDILHGKAVPSRAA